MNKTTNEFTIYEYPEKVRLGTDCDGGYVIGTGIGQYDCYISAGVSTEESFSRDFIHKYGMTRENSFAFDGTIHRYPTEYTNQITFICKNIGAEKNEHTANLIYFMEKYKNIFLKMDIEGSEYCWMSILTQDMLSTFKQIVIEFHGIYDEVSHGFTREQKRNCFQKLADTHYLIHVHGNNYSRLMENNLPNVMEFTYVRKDCFLVPPPLNQTPLPIPGLDMPNRKNHVDYSLTDGTGQLFSQTPRR